MANITETDSFDAGVYQLETTDPALGGANGIMNTPPRSLTNRTRFLLNRILDGILSFVADSGVKNAIVASFPQPITALVDGMEVSFRVAVLSDAAVTLKLTNTGGATLPTLPLWGGDHVALPGGELPAGATVRAKLNLTLNASNGGAWVISSITGGYARILTPTSGDMSNRAANMAAVFNATDGMTTVNVGVGADVVLTAAQCGCAILKLTGTPTAAINLVLPGGQTGQWVINNQQGGTNNITVKPSGGTGVVLPQGSSPTIVVSDGTTASFASAVAGQAAFTPIPITGVTGTTLTVPGGFTPGGIFIEKNGSLLEAPDFSAPTSPTITLTKAAISTDYFTIYRFNSFNVANAIQKSGDAMAGPLTVQPATASNNPLQLGQATGRLLNTIIYMMNAGVLQRSVNGSAFTNAPSSTYTPLSALATTAEAEVGGGGAGGGGAATTTAGTVSAGSGGAAGGRAWGIFPIASLAGQTVTVGAPGTASAGANGAPGGTSSIGAVMQATGGAAGTLGGAAASTTNALNGGARGGVGSGGQINSVGGAGQAAFYASTPVSGKGGMSFWGEGAFPVSGESAGTAAVSPCSGGSGGSLTSGSGSGAAGGAGMSGIVIIREWA